MKMAYVSCSLKTSLVLCVLMDFVSSEQYYCEFDSCSEEEYCCGYNKCCNKPLDLWFLWLGIVIICFALTIIAIIRCLRRRNVNTNAYREVPTNDC